MILLKFSVDFFFRFSTHSSSQLLGKSVIQKHFVWLVSFNFKDDKKIMIALKVETMSSHVVEHMCSNGQ